MCIHILQSVPLCSEKFYLLLFWSRLVHADLAMHATLSAIGTLPLYVPESPYARSATCKPCPMALVPDSTVHCSGPPTRNLDLSLSDHAQGPCVGFIYIQLSKLLKTAQACLKNGLGRFALSALPHYKHTLPRLARSTLNELQQKQHEKASLVRVRVQSPSGLALVPCALSMVDQSGQLRC